MNKTILTKAEFLKLDPQMQLELLEGWRRENTDKVIYQAMGMGSHSYYRLVKELGCTPKDTSPNRYKKQATTPVTPSNEEVVEEQPTPTQSTVQSITLALEHNVTKEQADTLFQSIVAFLGDGVYRIKVEVAK